MNASEPRGHLETERTNARTVQLDTLPIADALDCVLAEDATIVERVREARASIAEAIELIVPRLKRGGRLFYVGAGTSGRLGFLDAVECPPTFQSDPELVQGILAGGTSAFARAVEGAEDDAKGAHAELASRELNERDVVFGITAGGTTPFVHGALEFARDRGAATVFFACVPTDQVADAADVSIRVVTGPEVLAGSTRMKAGTATKLVLNTISTLVMTRLGKVHGNLMVDLNARSNAKLVERGERLIRAITGATHEEARTRLAEADYNVKRACIMQARGVDAVAADERLAQCEGILRRALED